MKADLKTFTTAMFSHNKELWENLDNSDKEYNFFIFNQFMAKQSPMHAQYFNDKGIDKSVACNIWKIYNKNYSSTPFWFWAGKKSSSLKEETELINEIAKLYDLDKFDILYLQKYNVSLYKEILKEFLEYKQEPIKTKSKKESKPKKTKSKK